MLKSILILSAIMAVTIMGILNNSFKNGSFTCDKYILNTYLRLEIRVVCTKLLAFQNEFTVF